MPKLGQLLVRQGWAAPLEIERALATQGAGGGRLGTALIENRVLGEDLLLKALSELHKVPGVGVEDLRDIPDDVIATLPAKLAGRCGAVPFRAFGTQVHVAMLDPRDLNCQDELAFALGKRVRPFVATEVRLLEALERYYGVQRDSRMKKLTQRLDTARYAETDPDHAPEPAPTAAGARSRRIWEQPEAALFSDERTRPAPPPPGLAGGAAVASAAVAAQPAPAPGSAARPRRTPRPSSVALTDDELAELRPIAQPEPAAPADRDEGEDTRPIPVGAPPLPLSFDDAEKRLATCETPDQIAALLVGFLGQRFERVALFKVLRDRVIGWNGTGPSLDAAAVRDFTTDFEQPSIFLNLRSAGSFYLGPLPPMAVHRKLARAWGGSLPRECLVLPVRIHGRLVTVVYLDRSPRGLGKLDLEALLQLTVGVAEAYERCILRKKKD